MMMMMMMISSFLSPSIRYLGTVDSADECEKRCVATAGCTSFSWDVSPASPNGWGQRCYGRLDGVWAPVAIQEVRAVNDLRAVLLIMSRLIYNALLVLSLMLAVIS